MSASVVDLEKQLKAVTKTGKYVVGRKEVLNGLKGSKLVVWSASANVPPRILDECRNLQVPAVRFDGNPIELGKTCGIPYKVSVIAVKSAGDASLGTFEKSEDYANPKSGFQRQQAAQQIPPVKTQEKEEKQEAKQKDNSRAAKKKKEDVKSNSRKSSRAKKEQEVKEKAKPSRKAKKENKEEEEEEEAKAEAEEDTDEEEED
jgi:large subunit ribosomal protein L30e